MALFKSNYAKGINAMPVAQGAEIVVAKLVYEIAAALALNDILHMGDLPAGHVMVDCHIASDDLDTDGAPAIVLEAGILNTAKTAIDVTKSGGAEWLDGSTIAQAGGFQRATNAAIARVPADDANNLPIGIDVGTAPATGAVTGTIELTVMYRSAQNGS